MDEETKAEQQKEKKEKKVKPPKPELPQLSNFPNISMVETGKAIMMAVEVPGFSRKDIKIGLNINSVSFSGKKQQILPEEKNKSLLSEVKHGVFNRLIKLPCDVDIRKSNVKARVKNGLLTMNLLKKDYKKVKSIPVT
jgi:HSP20 family protein